MRFSKPIGTLAVTLVLSASAFAQNVRIIYPQQGQDVRGEVTMRFEGVPAGGYAIIKIDGQFKQASAQQFVVFDTLGDRVTFPKGDGNYKVNITVLSAGGGQVGTDEVTFNVANSKVDEAGEAVRLVHWTNADRIKDQVMRFRVFAESNANIEGGAAAGGAGGGGGGGGAMAGGGGTEGGTESFLPAPLDYQVAALMRRVVRDVFTRDRTANISTIVQESFERGREGGNSGAGAATAAGGDVVPKRRKKNAAPSAPTKGPWLPLWTKSEETGKMFTKRIEPSGQEVNATRKSAVVAIADLLPSFPDAPVHPGSTWETKMSILGDLTSRLPINVQAPITFTAYDTLLTPNGENRRCAKLESRFRLPDNLAKKIAVNLGNKSGSGAGGGGTGGAASGPGGGIGPAGVGGNAGAADTGLTEEDIEVARTDVARVLWFDMDNRQILRSEDTIRSYFEIPPTAGEAGGGMGGAPMGGMGGGEAGGAAAPAEPTKISYNLSVTSWLDDRIPGPNDGYTGGLGTAHAVDNVVEPGLARVRGGR